MQSLFNRPSQPSAGIIVSPQWSTARAGLSRNLAQVLNYYQTHAMATKSNHLLARLLGAARLNYEVTLERFYGLADVMSNPLSNAMEFTSSISPGRVHDGVFYGKGSSEIIIGSTEGFDVHEAARQWKYQSPVKVIYHEKSDLDMHIPNGLSYSQEKGAAVISVNIPMLFVVYRGFVLEQMEALKRGQKAKSTSQFLHMYVLPNMVPSHLDFALFNRALLIAMDLPAALGTARKHPFSMANWTNQTDRTLNELIHHLKRANHSMHDMLCTLPAVTNLNGAQTMELPAVSQTLQYAWVELLARARVIAGCIFISPSRLLATDKANLQQVSRSIAYEGMIKQLTGRLGATNAADTLEMVSIIQDTVK